MFTVIYVIFALCVTFFTLTFFGYGLVHGGELLVVPIILLCLAIFLVPLYVDKKFRSRWKYSYVAYLFPAIFMVLPAVYIFLLKPHSEKIIADSVLEKVVITPISEEVIKNEQGDVLGLKFIYSTRIPEDISRLIDLGEDMRYFSLPTPELTKRSGEHFSLLEIGYTETTKDGLASPAGIEKLKSGQYVTEAWLLGQYTKRMDGVLCRSKYFDENAASSTTYRDEKQPIFVSVSSRVNFSNRMGMYYFSHLANYELKDQVSGPEILNTARTLELCPRDY